jgi:hypothetical protein
MIFILAMISRMALGLLTHPTSYLQDAGKVKNNTVMND